MEEHGLRKVLEIGNFHMLLIMSTAVLQQEPQTILSAC